MQINYPPFCLSALFGLALSALLAGSGCTDKVRSDEVIFTKDDAAIEVAHGVKILYSDSAVVRVRITAPLLHNYVSKNNQEQVFPEGVKVEFLDGRKRVESVLTAKTGTRKPEKGLIIARDSVVLTTVEGEKLESEELIWDEKTAKIRTDKFVKVSQPGEVIYGYGLEAEQDFSYWRILVPQGRIKVDKPE